MIIISNDYFDFRYDPKQDRLYASSFTFKLSETKTLGAIFIGILRSLGLVEYKKVAETADTYECSNLTIINLILVKLGPIREQNLTILLLAIQILCTGLALFIRYGVSKIFY